MKKLKKLVKTTHQQNKKSKQTSKRCSSAFDETRRQWYKNLVVKDDVTTSSSSESEDDDRIESIKYYFKKDSSLYRSRNRKLVSRSHDLLNDHVTKRQNSSKASSSYDNLISLKNGRIAADNISRPFLVKETYDETKENTVSVLTGQIVKVIDDSHYFWAYVKRSDGRKGFVPKTHLVPLPNEEEDSPPTEKGDSPLKEQGGEKTPNENGNITSKSPVILPEKNEYMKSTNLARVSPFNQNSLCEEVQNIELETFEEIKNNDEELKPIKNEENYLEKGKITDSEKESPAVAKKHVRFSSKVLEFAEIKDASDYIDAYIQEPENVEYDPSEKPCYYVDNGINNGYQNQTDAERRQSDDYKDYLVQKYLRKKITRRNSFVYNENKYSEENDSSKMYYSDTESTEYYKKRKYYGDKRKLYDEGDNETCGSWC